VVTKAGEERLDEQPDPDRWYYEVEQVTKLLREENRAELNRRLDVMLDVIGTLEMLRKRAGITFPGDE